MRRSATLKLVLWLAAAFACGALSVHKTEAQDVPKQLPLLADGRYELKGGDFHSYRINLTAGQFLYALIEQQGIDVTVSVFNPDGSPLSYSDSPNDRFGSEPALMVAETSGEYRVELRAPNTRASAAHYQIKIVALREEACRWC